MGAQGCLAWWRGPPLVVRRRARTKVLPGAAANRVDTLPRYPAMNPLAPLSSAASRPAFSSSPPAARTAADAQGALANRLAERLGLPAGALHGKGDGFSPEQVAGRVLGFIEQRLHSAAAAGADPAKLQGLLSQAREGVEKGFAEARKILDGMGVLHGEVAADIDASYQRIQDGLGDLEQRFSPAPPADGRALAAYSERFSALAETFELAVTTRDGDRLRISVAQASARSSRKCLTNAVSVNASSPSTSRAARTSSRNCTANSSRVIGMAAC